MSEEELRTRALNAARDYFIASRGRTKFVPGQSYIPVTVKCVDEEDLATLVDASLDMWLTTGRYGRQFESEFSRLFGRNVKSILVNSGSSANLVAISSLGSPELERYGVTPLRPGDEVITVAAGFPTTVNPIVQNGWIPVFVDIDLSTINALVPAIQAAQTDRTRAVVLAHTLGNPYRADLLAQWCQEQGLMLIEDCCDALGSTIGGHPVGSFGVFATCSFYPAHHITMGEGGAVVPRDARWKRIAESIRDWGRDCWCEPGKDNTCGKRYCWQLGDLPEGYDHKYTYSHVGYNLKVTDMQAALGVSQLRKLPRFVEERRGNWRKLHEGFCSSPVLKRWFAPVTATPGTDPSWFGFPLLCVDGMNRDLVVRELEQRKIGTRLLFAGNLTKQPAYKEVRYRVHGTLSNTDTVMNDLFWLGVHPALCDESIGYILEQTEAVAQLVAAQLKM